MKNIMIKDIPVSERPREKAIKNGVESLTNEELISIIISTGTKNYSVKDLSNKILSCINNINDLKDLRVNTLSKIDGIGSVKAITLLSSLELGKRVYYSKAKDKIKLNNAKVIYDLKELLINHLFIQEKYLSMLF